MLKKLLLWVAACVFASGMAFAQVDVNKADQSALDGVRGIGPAMSKRILEERQKGGAFKDWPDLEKRVKGIKDKSAVRLSSNGLTVNGQAKAGAAPGPAAVKASSRGARNEDKPKADEKAEGKARDGQAGK